MFEEEIYDCRCNRLIAEEIYFCFIVTKNIVLALVFVAIRSRPLFIISHPPTSTFPLSALLVKQENVYYFVILVVWVTYKYSTQMKDRLLY
jgi:hypothetical protein